MVVLLAAHVGGDSTRLLLVLGDGATRSLMQGLWDCCGSVGCHRVPNLGTSCFGDAVAVSGVTVVSDAGLFCCGDAVVVWGVTRSPIWGHLALGLLWWCGV